MVPFTRESGSGPTVLCMHANASSSSQWRGLTELLAPHFRVVAADGLGAGRSPPWPDRPGVRLADEVALLAPVLAQAGERFHVVGHSYGGAMAIKVALAMPERIASLVLFEPTLFALLRHDDAGRAAAGGIVGAVEAASAALERDDAEAAACAFIDYWMGEGAWSAMPVARRPAVAEAVRNVRGWAEALFDEPADAAEIAGLGMPVTLLRGSDTTASARGVFERLATLLPHAERTVLEGVGHMAPVTHPDVVNEAIARFLLARR